MSRTYAVFSLLVVLALLLTACGDEDKPESLKANAGEDFGVKVGEAPTFDACKSTGDIQNFRWIILQAPETKAADNGKVIRANESNCRFTLEDTMVIEELGQWVIQLEIEDADGKKTTDTVTVTVTE